VPDSGHPAYVSIEYAAQHLDLSKLTIRRMIADGSLQAFRVGKTRSIRVRGADLEALLTPIPAAAS